MLNAFKDLVKDDHKITLSRISGLLYSICFVPRISSALKGDGLRSRFG